jgi:hypothetical protein
VIALYHDRARNIAVCAALVLRTNIYKERPTLLGPQRLPRRHPNQALACRIQLPQDVPITHWTSFRSRQWFEWSPFDPKILHQNPQPDAQLPGHTRKSMQQ